MWPFTRKCKHDWEKVGPRINENQIRHHLVYDILKLTCDSPDIHYLSGYGEFVYKHASFTPHDNVQNRVCLSCGECYDGLQSEVGRFKMWLKETEIKEAQRKEAENEALKRKGTAYQIWKDSCNNK